MCGGNLSLERPLYSYGFICPILCRVLLFVLLFYEQCVFSCLFIFNPVVNPWACNYFDVYMHNVYVCHKEMYKTLYSLYVYTGNHIIPYSMFASIVFRDWRLVYIALPCI